MTTVSFTAPLLLSDGTFTPSRVTFLKVKKEWTCSYVYNDEKETFTVELGEGYDLVKTVMCGICSTDLERHYMSFPLPQVIGHEVIGEYDGELVCVDINGSHFMRGLKTNCPFCTSIAFHTQCPIRTTLGIDILPGGFAPYFLAPIRSLYPIGDLNLNIAVLLEPFTAALHCTDVTPPKNGNKVCIFGVRRLGLLVLLALYLWRKKYKVDFEIICVARHKHITDICLSIGADRALLPPQIQSEQFDIVIDCTGTPDGLKDAFLIAKKTVHIKSTHGKSSLGMKCISPFVVDELAIVPFCEKSFSFTWPNEETTRRNNFVLCCCEQKDCLTRKAVKTNSWNIGSSIVCCSIEKAISMIDNKEITSPFELFDLAVVFETEIIDRVIRPFFPHSKQSLLRPRGAILFALGTEDFLSESIVKNGKKLYSSRCGDIGFTKDFLLEMYEREAQAINYLTSIFITKREKLENITKAFEEARKPENIKVVIEMTK